MRTLLPATLLLVFAVHAHADPEIKGSPSELASYLSNVPRLVTLTGESEVKIQADQADVTFRITTEQRSLADALQGNNEVQAKMVRLLEVAGIKGDRVHPSKFSSTPKHGVFTEKVKSQRVQKLIWIRVHDENEFQVVAALPDKFPEVVYAGTEFSHSQKDQFKAQAIREACDDANRSARVFEQQLRLKLTPRGFTEQAFRRTFTDIPGARGGSLPSYSSSPRSEEEAIVARKSDLVTEFGELIFKATVKVDYAAEPQH